MPFWLSFCKHCNADEYLHVLNGKFFVVFSQPFSNAECLIWSEKTETKEINFVYMTDRILPKSEKRRDLTFNFFKNSPKPEHFFILISKYLYYYDRGKNGHRTMHFKTNRDGAT